MTKYHNDDENLAKLCKKKAPERKETKCKGPQFKQAKEPQRRESHEGKESKRPPKRRATWRKGNH
jgi:hypothetical protein